MPASIQFHIGRVLSLKAFGIPNGVKRIDAVPSESMIRQNYFVSFCVFRPHGRLSAAPYIPPPGG